jgi:hypothetical protein
MVSASRLFSLKDSRSSAPVACSLISPKSQNSNIRHDGTLSIRNFMLVLKNPMDLNFEPLRSIGINGHDPAKVQKFKYMHDGALSIRNFALNQAQLLISHSCQLTNNQNMCSLLPSYTEFPIYLWILLLNLWKNPIERFSLKFLRVLFRPF